MSGVASDQRHAAAGVRDQNMDYCAIELSPDNTSCDDVDEDTNDDVSTAGTCSSIGFYYYYYYYYYLCKYLKK